MYEYFIYFFFIIIYIFLYNLVIFLSAHEQEENEGKSIRMQGNGEELWGFQQGGGGGERP